MARAAFLLRGCQRLEKKESANEVDPLLADSVV